jgi:ZIP family zinc transporter
MVSDRIVEGRFGGEGGSGALGIVVGAVVDGKPESVIFGIQIAAGQPLSVALLAAVWVSNIPQALAPSADLARSGWHAGRLATMWALVIAACGVTAGLGYLLAAATGGRAAAFAAGGLLPC